MPRKKAKTKKGKKKQPVSDSEESKNGSDNYDESLTDGIMQGNNPK